MRYKQIHKLLHFLTASQDVFLPSSVVSTSVISNRTLGPLLLKHACHQQPQISTSQTGTEMLRTIFSSVGANLHIRVWKACEQNEDQNNLKMVGKTGPLVAVLELLIISHDLPRQI